MKKCTFRGVGIFLSLFLSAGLLLAGCSDDDGDRSQEVAEENGLISGQIVQGNTQQPVLGLTVAVRSGEAEDTETDENGLFEVDGLAPTIAAPLLLGAPPVGTIAGQGHLVTISDQREVADVGDTPDEDQIAAETDRLATKQYRVHIGQDIGGANQPFDVDMGIIAMNRQASINVQVNLENGTTAPAGVTVVAIPVAGGGGALSGINSACNATLQGINPVIPPAPAIPAVTPVAVPVSATTNATGAATLNGLDRCQNYQVAAPAQVVGGLQMRTAITAFADLATVEDINGSTLIALALVEATLDEALVAVAVNMNSHPEFQAALGVAPPVRPSLAFTFGASTNVSNAGTFGITNTQAEFTAALAGNLVVVFNLPVTVDNDIALTSTNDLVDPDPADDGIDATFGATVTLAGVTGAVDATGTVLTIAHTTALTANQIYTMQGTLRTAGSNLLSALNTLNSTGSFGGSGTVYATDSSVAPLATNITADNLNGTSDGTGGANTVSLQFREAVAGTIRVIAITTGSTRTEIGGGNIAVSPAGGTRLASSNVDPAPVGACTVCAAANGVTFSFSTGMFLNDNIVGTVNNIEVFVDVVDTEGNRLVQTLTLPIL